MTSYSLGFNFQPIEMGRNNTIKFCNFNVTYSEGLKELVLRQEKGLIK